jgi:hypothetical protein
MELADQQVSESEGNSLTGAEIPVAADVPAAATATEKPEKPLSLREQIVKNVETVRTEEAKRARAADGKFAKLEGAAEQPAATDKVQPEKKEAQPEPASKPFAPPPGFSPETKAFLATLPADHPIKRDIEKREGEVSNGIKSYSDKAKQLDAIEQVIAPVRQTFQQAGIQSDAEAIKALFNWEQSFRNPVTRTQAFHMLAKQYGLDLSTLVPSSPSGSPSAAQDIPDPLRPVIDQFGQRVESLDARIQNWEQAQVAEKLTAFAADPKHSHFETVRADMGRLMSAGFVQPGDLEGAYQKAISMNPEMSAQIRAADEAKRADDLAKANTEKVRKAVAAAVSPSARPPSGAPAGQPSKGGSKVRESILNAVSSLREERRA